MLNRRQRQMCIRDSGSPALKLETMRPFAGQRQASRVFVAACFGAWREAVFGAVAFVGLAAGLVTGSGLALLV